MAKSVRESQFPFGNTNSPIGEVQGSNQKFPGFAARLQQAAQREGLISAQIAKELKLTNTTFGRYWNGERLPPSDTLVDLAALLGVSERWLIRGIDAHGATALRDSDGSEWVTLPEYDLRAVTDEGKGDPISSVTIRRDWLYLSLGESLGLWIAKTLTADRIQGLPAGVPIVCKDLPRGEAPLDGQHYIFRVNGGVLLARFSYRSAGILAAGDRVGEVVVTPADLDREDGQHFIIARVLGALARPFV